MELFKTKAFDDDNEAIQVFVMSEEYNRLKEIIANFIEIKKFESVQL